MTKTEIKAEMTPSESLQIISSYIEDGRKGFIRSSAKPLILWGTIVILVAIAVFFLWKYTGNPAWNYLWFAIPVIGGIASAAFIKREPKQPKTFITSAIASIWLIFGIVTVLFAAATLALAHFNPGWGYAHADIISTTVVVLLGVCEAITGAIIDKKIIVATGIVSALALGFCISMASALFSPIIIAVAGVLTLLFPGLILRRK